MKQPLKYKSLFLSALLLAAGVAFGSAAVTHALDRSDVKAGSIHGPVSVTVDDHPLLHSPGVDSSFAPVVQKVAPCVVNVFTTKTRQNSAPDIQQFFEDPLFRRFFGVPFGGNGSNNQPRTFKEHSLGSGVVITADGYILTNNHVVDGADDVQVAFEKDKTKYDATVVGRDPQTDIAVLKIDAGKLPFVTLSDSDKIAVGDVVLALGNPFGVGQTVTMGIVSATGRGGMGIEDYEDFIQTDAAINPGNSGGALVDTEGRLIGINTAILTRSGGNQGVGFAVPINLARSVMQQLVETGKVERGYLGVTIQDLTPELAKDFDSPNLRGALIGEVTKDGPAAAAGLKSGDVITRFDGRSVQDSRKLRLMVGGTAPGTKVELTALRDGKQKTFSVTLKEVPQQTLANAGQPGQEKDDVLDGMVVGDLDSASRGQLNIPDSVQGAVITEINPSSPAYEAGLRVGDVVQEIDRKPVRNAEEAVAASEHIKANHALLRVWSHGGSHFVVVEESHQVG